jgi:hypothetical protein
VTEPTCRHRKAPLFRLSSKWQNTAVDGRDPSPYCTDQETTLHDLEANRD